MRSGIGSLSKHVLLLVVTVLALFPVYVMVTAAFKTQQDFLAHPWSPFFRPTLRGFDAALSDQFPAWFANTAMLSVGAVVFTLALATLAGWGFARWTFRGRDTVLGVLVSLMVVPPSCCSCRSLCSASSSG